jgi:ankyrin repeat protein
MKIIIFLMIVMIIVSLMFKKELEGFQTSSSSNADRTTPTVNSDPSTPTVNSDPSTPTVNSAPSTPTVNSTTMQSNSNRTTSAENTVQTTTVFEENTKISFLVDFRCDANNSSMTTFRNSVEYLVREALISDSNYSISYNCHEVEHFNNNDTGYIEIEITMNKVYEDNDERGAIIRNLTNRFQNGIIVNGTTHNVKKYRESDNSFLKVQLNNIDSPSVTEESIKFIETNVNGRLGDLLSKNSCVDEENTCNFGHEPYSLLRLDGRNPDTNNKFTKNEKNNLISRYNNKCSSNEDTVPKRCCDPNDSALNNIVDQLPYEYKSKFPAVLVDKCNNKVKSFKVCRGSACDNDDRIPRTPSAYEYCKLLNVNDNDIDSDGTVNLSKLVPDCYTSKCSNNNIYLTIDKKKNLNETITKHYYLIEAAKNDNVDFLKANYEDERANVNEIMEYGYPGNTILHEVVFYNAERCTEYLLTKNVDLSKTNKDGNSVLHIACLRGNYKLVNRILKLGASVDCYNNKGDTSLHSAVRSGSYNTVLVVIDNGGSSSILKENNYGEIPLHTAVVKRLNLNIIQLLIENGSEVHNINRYGETIIKTLMKNHKSVARESIRTFLQRKYYEKYDEGDYNKYLKKYPELRPVTIDTEVNDELKKDYQNYNDDGINFKKIISYPDENIRNDDLYVDKKTYLIKDKINPQFFNNRENFTNDSNIEEFTNLTNVIYNNSSNNKHYKLLLFVIIVILVFLLLKKFN